ncbi:hypothetical protein AC1031_005861 [Aphanomyces cochlioides]|nr:hypothetical protein AC1031_005861 [Aphanomyces cochlioides]
MDEADEWPELHIRQVEWIESFASRAVYYVKRVHTHCLIDPEALRQILLPHNVLIIECSKKHGSDELSTSWIDKIVTIPVDEIEMCGLNIGPWVEYGFYGLSDDFFDFIAQSTLTRLSILVVDMRGQNDRRTNLDNHKLNQLTQWLSNQPVIEFDITLCDVNADKEVVNKFYNALWSCKRFSCFSTEFPKFAVDFISQPIQWRRLDVGECEINVEKARGLASGLRNSNVESLNLNLNVFSTEAMELIMSSLGQSNVSEMSFVGCELSLPHLEIIAKYLRSTMLKKLDLYDNDIRVAGIKAVMPAVTQSQLEELNVAYSCIDAAAVEIIAEILPSTKLTSLNLDYNYINDEGAQYLAEALEKSSHLREISLIENCLSLEGIEHLVNKLNGRTPTTLHVCRNYFSMDNTEKIERGNAIIESAASQGHTIEL